MTKPKAIKLLVSLLIILPVLLLVVMDFSYEEWRFQRKVDRELSAGVNTIPLAQLTDFEWDMVCRSEDYRFATGEDLWGLDFYRCEQCNAEPPYYGRDLVKQIRFSYFDEDEEAKNKSVDCLMRDQAALQNNNGKITLIRK